MIVSIVGFRSTYYLCGCHDAEGHGKVQEAVHYWSLMRQILGMKVLMRLHVTRLKMMEIFDSVHVSCLLTVKIRKWKWFHLCVVSSFLMDCLRLFLTRTMCHVSCLPLEFQETVCSLIDLILAVVSDARARLICRKNPRQKNILLMFCPHFFS